MEKFLNLFLGTTSAAFNAGTATFGGALTGTSATFTSTSTADPLTLDGTTGNYSFIIHKYGGAIKGVSGYNAGDMYYGGESGTGTKLQAGGVVGLSMDASTRAITLSSLGTGAVQATAGVLSVVSDGRVKSHLGKFKGSALSAINKLQAPEYWRYNAKSGMPKEAQAVKQFSLYADKVYDVLGEEFAPTQKDGMHSLSDRALLSLAIQAIQELQAEVKKLKK